MTIETLLVGKSRIEGIKSLQRGDCRGYFRPPMNRVNIS